MGEASEITRSNVNSRQPSTLLFLLPLVVLIIVAKPSCATNQQPKQDQTELTKTNPIHSILFISLPLNPFVGKHMPLAYD